MEAQRNEMVRPLVVAGRSLGDKMRQDRNRDQDENDQPALELVMTHEEVKNRSRCRDNPSG